MGELNVDLATIDHDGAVTDLWYPLALSGRMKLVTGEVLHSRRKIIFNSIPNREPSILCILGTPEDQLQPSPNQDQSPW